MKVESSHISIILRKELVDNLRDRRSVLSAFITPLVMPAFLVALIVVVGRSVIVTPVEQSLVLPVQGEQNAPALVSFLQQSGVMITSAPADAKNAVRSGSRAIILIIPDDYPNAFKEGQPARVEIVYDSSNQANTATVERVRTLISNYNQQISSLRLMARGINPQVTSPLVIQGVDVATPQAQTLIFLNMLPFLMVVVIFMGGMYVIIDTTAGERERGSLEPLLVNPATREEFVLGKLLASLPFAGATLLISLAGFWVAFNAVPLENYVGIPVSIAFSTLSTIFVISLPLILLASGLQMVIATFTRSFKEAQTYLALLPLIAGLPGAFLTFLPIRASLGAMFIPVFSQTLLINQAMRGEAAPFLYGLLSAVVTLGLSLILVWGAVRLYQSEKVLFGK